MLQSLLLSINLNHLKIPETLFHSDRQGTPEKKTYLYYLATVSAVQLTLEKCFATFFLSLFLFYVKKLIFYLQKQRKTGKRYDPANTK